MFRKHLIFLHMQEEPVVDLSVSAQDETMSAQHKELERGGYDCEFVKPPPTEFHTQCRICLQILRNPQLISCCGNHFCLSCIEPIKVQGKNCPLCNCSEYTVVHDKGLERTIKEFKVHCVHYDAESGCQWTGELQQLDEHLKQCHPNGRPTPLDPEGMLLE